MKGHVTSLIDTFIEYLKAEDVRVVFGVPGGLLHPFFAAVEVEPRIELVIAKHEAGACFMADGYARTRRSLAVVAGTSGPGSTNLLTGVAVAHSDGIPLLVVTGQAPSQALGQGAAQETTPEDIDIVGMFRPVTKYSAMIRKAGRFPHHLRRALRLALSGRQGPVHLNIPVDFWSEHVDVEPLQPDRYRPSSSPFDRSAVKRAAAALVGAGRPAILAGSGVHRAGARVELLRLAQHIRAPVATTPAGKSVFPGDHPQSLGVLGFAGHESARSTIFSEEVDVLLCMGTSLNETTTFNWHPDLMPREVMIHLDIDIDRIARSYPVDIALVGDLRTVLKEIHFELKRVTERLPMQSTWEFAEAPPTGEEHYLHPELRRSDQVPVTPQRWRLDLLEVLPEDAIVFSDIGGHMLFNIHNLRFGREQQFHINLGFGSMGHGTVAPIGAAFGAPNRPIFAIVGDACVTMNGMEMLVAVEWDLPVLWIVENNHMHGITWHGSQVVGGREPMDCVVYRDELRLYELASAMGVESHRIEAPGELQPLVRNFLERPVPTLIDVQVDASISPPLGARAQTVGGFPE